MPSFVVALIALIAFAVPAAATAISSVQEAFWQVDFGWYDDGHGARAELPAGVELSCTGTAVSDGGLGCLDSGTAIVISADGTWKSQVVDRIGGLLLRNSGGPVGGVFSFNARFGSFYPALPDSGARVDNGASESADYFAVVQGAGGFDLHGCNMASAPGKGGPHACRPTSPSYQDSSFTLGPSTDWTEMAADWRIYIQVSAQGVSEANDPVPEPPALALFLAGAAAMAYRRKARSPRRQTRRLSGSTER